MLQSGEPKPIPTESVNEALLVAEAEMKIFVQKLYKRILWQHYKWQHCGCHPNVWFIELHSENQVVYNTKFISNKNSTIFKHKTIIYGGK